MAIQVDQKEFIGGGPGLTFARPVSLRMRRLARLLLVLTVLLVIGTASLYYWLQFRLRPEVEALQAQIQSLNAAEQVTEAQRFVVLQSQLRALRAVLENHIYGSNFFSFLEGITHPKVRFISLDADLSQRQIKLSGQAASFSVLAEQLKILESDPNVERFLSSNFKTEQTGTISFLLDVTFKSNVLRK